MTTRVGPRMRRVKKLARAGAWAATTAMLMLSIAPGQQWTWMWVALVCMVALNAVGVAAAIAELKADGRYQGIRRKGGGLSGHGHHDGDGPAGGAAHQWRALAVVSRLMPGSAGRRWLAEAESVLAEVAAARRGAALRSYLLSAPRLAVMMWARQVLRRLRLGPRRPG